MRTVAIVQARMGSSRLPGKVLLDVGGITMLARVVRRTQRADLVDEVVVATTAEQADDAVAGEGRNLGVAVFRGSEHDVLDRYYKAAQFFGAQVVVRITSDCPLIDPEIIDRVVGAFRDAQPDYASNVLKRSYPRGLDTEVMSVSALERAWREAAEPYQRVHVTPYFYQNPELFRLVSVTHDEDWSRLRWTVDTVDDLAFVREVYRRLLAQRPTTTNEVNNTGAGWMEILSLLAQDPALAEMNLFVRQKQVDEG